MNSIPTAAIAIASQVVFRMTADGFPVQSVHLLKPSEDIVISAGHAEDIQLYTSDGLALLVPQFQPDEIRICTLPIAGREPRGVIFAEPYWDFDCNDAPDQEDDVLRVWASFDIIQILSGLVAGARRPLTRWWKFDLYDFQRGCSEHHFFEDFTRRRLDWLHPEGWQGDINHYWSEAVEHVRSNWDAILNLADLLTRKGTLSRDEIGEWLDEWLMPDAA